MACYLHPLSLQGAVEQATLRRRLPAENAESVALK